MTQTLNLYKNNATWLFDDPEKDIVAEPFVEGSSELITAIQGQMGLSGSTLSVSFSDEPFPESRFKLEWRDSRDDGTWNQYYSKRLDMENWLCPVLLRYFQKAPKKLYMAVTS